MWFLILNMFDTNETSQLHRWCCRISIFSGVASGYHYILYVLHTKLAQQIAKATLYTNINDLCNVLQSNNQPQYIALHGTITTTTPLQSTYVQPVIQLVYQRILKYWYYVPEFWYNGPDTYQNTYNAVDCQLILPSHSTSNTLKHMVTVSKQLLLTSQQWFTKRTNLLTESKQHATQTPLQWLFSMLLLRFTKYEYTAEYGIRNNSDVTIIAHAKLNTYNQKQIDLIDGNTVDTHEPIVISDKPYDIVANDIQLRAKQLQQSSYIFAALSMLSVTVIFGRYGYDIYAKRQTLKRMQQLHSQRNNRIQQSNPLPIDDTTQPNGNAEYEGICVICYERKSNAVFVDCFHQCCCQQCSETLLRKKFKCPMCNRRILEYRVPYII